MVGGEAELSGCVQDAEAHGECKTVSAYVAMLEENSVAPVRGSTLLLYVACTPSNAPFLLGRALFKDMKGIRYTPQQPCNTIQLFFSDIGTVKCRWSDSPLVRRPIVPKTNWSDGPLVRKPIVNPTPLSVENWLFNTNKVYRSVLPVTSISTSHENKFSDLKKPSFWTRYFRTNDTLFRTNGFRTNDTF